MDDRTAGAGSFDAWYRAEHPRVLALLTVVALGGDLGSEVTAEAFTRALERWDRVAEMDSPAAWTYRVGVNLARRRLRRAAIERRLWSTPTTDPPPSAIEPELWAAVPALPARQRTAIALRYVCDLPQAEVAAGKGVAVGTVSATLTTARRRLAAVLGQHDADAEPLGSAP